MKYQRGNRVSAKDLNGNYREAVIKETSSYESASRTVYQYYVRFLDDGDSLAWIIDNNIKYIDEGGEYLIKQAEDSWKKTLARETNLKWILDNWAKSKGVVSANTVLFLFDRLGIDTSFNRNGEYYILQLDYAHHFPLINDFMTLSDKALEHINGLRENESKKEKWLQFYNEVKLIKEG